jgi:hypothetical protein
MLGVIAYRAVYFLANDVVPTTVDVTIRPLLLVLPACLLSLPFDVLRRRVMQLPVTDRRSALAYARHVYELEGPQAFFAGWQVAVLQTIIGSGVYSLASSFVNSVKTAIMA